MKRALAFMLALILVLSLGIGASATEPDDSANGTITITNPTADQTYYLYKLFDASYATDDQGNIILNENGKPNIAYTIKNDGTYKFFDAMFGASPLVHPELGQASDYFDYVTTTGVVSEKKGISPTNLYKFLGWLADQTSITADDQITADADDETIIFEGLETGYYLINRGTASTVTITTSTPNVKVIDKNQKPNANDSFDKLVYDEDYVNPETGEVGRWVTSSTANIGDIITWKIPFEATNYDGEGLVMYYTLRDTKSSSLWVEFNSITIKVGNETLGKGYYWCASDDPNLDTDDWNATADPEQWTDDPAEADWYLIHYTVDEFEIVIPWLDDYTFTGLTDYTKGYKLDFDLKTDDGNNILSTSMHDSPVSVEISYTASVGPGAANGESKNSAALDWVTTKGTFGPEDPQETVTKVYNMGITKVAGGSNDRLEGAVFELYRDKECQTDPIYVIPTGEDGVYILDDIATNVSGENRVTVREYYDESAWLEYILNDPNPDTPNKEETDPEIKKQYNKRNDVVSPANGQIVIMGLEAGTYYVKETKAPSGYNLLAVPESITVGEGGTSTYDNNYVVYSKVIENNSGTELPSTGGAGTVMLITFGSMIAMAFAVLMITQKKMSVYHD